MPRLILLLSTLSLLALLAVAEAPRPENRRDRARKDQQQGNFKDAFQVFRALALDPADDPKQVGSDLRSAIECLVRLGRGDEVDTLRDQVVGLQGGNWRLLAVAAESLTTGPHDGFLIAGTFQRGPQRGNDGRQVDASARDRVLALQWLAHARSLAANDPDRPAVASLFLQSAQRILLGDGDASWHLQRLTDLATLPDYEEGHRWQFRANQAQGTPVDAEGNPVVFRLPASEEAARNDGERWRWLLARAEAIDPTRHAQVLTDRGGLAQHQFGVKPDGMSGDDDDNPAAKELRSLGDDETIATLATGPKRLKLADEFNPIKLFEQVASGPRSDLAEAAFTQLITIFSQRTQFPRAEETLRQAFTRYGPGPDQARLKQLQQITGNWGVFEPTATQPAGRPATVDFRFRNGKKVRLEAREVQTDLLLKGIRSYLMSRPKNLDWSRIDLNDVGNRVVSQGEGQFLGPVVATWDLALDPRPEYLDRRVTVKTPLQKPGAYLLTAKMAGGNVGRVLVWVADLAMIRKATPEGALYFVADAVSGAPVAGANVEFLGWNQVVANPAQGGNRFVAENFAERTDANGLANLRVKAEGKQWVAIARAPTGRLAFLGFDYISGGGSYDPFTLNQTKVFVATDRPIYRPDQKVKFKFWIRQAAYEGVDDRAFAHKPYLVKINNPNGETVFTLEKTTDAFGGLDGEFSLPADAPLGAYSAFIEGQGGGTFRVEEYKKPEFEVLVDAPTEPVKLGETFEAKIRANYYFGGPVTSAKVSYKVMRTTAPRDWFPAGRWDWLYGPGYGWLGRSYSWFPGWLDWGCTGPGLPWRPRSFGPPEVITQAEVPIGPDGTVKVIVDTGPAKAAHGREDHQYTITAEVVDASRRTITGSGSVQAGRSPFRVLTTLDRGYYRDGQEIRAEVSARSLDEKPVAGKGKLTLLKVHYQGDKPVEEAVETWDLDTNAQGQARQTLKAARAGQYRLAYTLTDARGRSAEGASVFVVRGDGFNGRGFRFNDLELIPDKREYAPGETVRLMVNTEKTNGTVLLFIRPVNGLVLPPQVVKLDGKSTVREIAVAKADMPNFFVEALTIADGHVFGETAEILVPPESRTLKVELTPSRESYKPGAPARVKVRLTNDAGQPFQGSAALTIYDKALDALAGGTNVPEIRAFFWQWRRAHYPQTVSSLDRSSSNLMARGEFPMLDLSGLGQTFWGFGGGPLIRDHARGDKAMFGIAGMAMSPAMAAPAPAGAAQLKADAAEDRNLAAPMTPAPDASAAMVQPTVRKAFADSAAWAPTLTTDADGTAEVSLTMPENLTGWKIRTWGMGKGTEVGQGEAEVTTTKDVLIRLQAPRFFVQTDEVVLSANVHNALKVDKDMQAVLELEGGVLEPLDAPERQIVVKAGGETRVDWRVKVVKDGEAVIRVKALSDEESDAMEQRFPALIHGIARTEPFTGSIRPEAPSAKFTFRIPEARREADTRVEIRFSPTLAGALVEAIPYLSGYPYGCTEQTLNRFVPTVIAQGTLKRMGLDLAALKTKRTNLNAAELGDPAKRAEGWKQPELNPVFDEAEVANMVRDGLKALAAMQCDDGGWGWFSGSSERSGAHTTAIVVHGLQLARVHDVALVPDLLERGMAWLKDYQTRQVRQIQNAPAKVQPYKERADDLDALVALVLADADVVDPEMLNFLDQARPQLSVYALTLLARAAEKAGQAEILARSLKNIEQYLVRDAETQTAYLRLPEGWAWWSWHGDDAETQASYLKLLSKTDPKGETAPALAKYLLNNRKHATYWGSTRDTALAVEALADYLKASGEDKPDMTVALSVDGKILKQVPVNAANLFAFDNALILQGAEVGTGEHTVEITRKGAGPVYFNAFVSVFTLEDPIPHAGLDLKVERKLYRIHPEQAQAEIPGDRGQVVPQQVKRDRREELTEGATLKSGETVEVELAIDAKNDYEYLAFEDPKPAGCEPLETLSGYNGNDLNAYVEFRDQKVVFFARTLARGRHSVRYRLRAEIPGKFSALPTTGYGMYAPELRGNADEAKVSIED